MEKEKKEIYISHSIEHCIEEALYAKDESDRMLGKEELATDLFNYNLEDAENFLKLCSTDKMQALLEEIAYWDSPAEDVYHMGKYYDYCRPLLEEYAEKTGYIIRWKAYNEKFGLPVPEDDTVTWESVKDYNPNNIAEVYYNNDHPSLPEIWAVNNLLDIVKERRMVLNSVHVVDDNVCAVLGDGDMMLRYAWDEKTGELSEVIRDRKEDQHLLRIWRDSKEDRIIERIASAPSWMDLDVEPDMVTNIGEEFDKVKDSTLVYSDFGEEHFDACDSVLLVFKLPTVNVYDVYIICACDEVEGFRPYDIPLQIYKAEYTADEEKEDQYERSC